MRWGGPGHPDPSATTLTATYDCSYDAWNRLIEVKGGSNVVAKFEYDGLGRRTKKFINTGQDQTYDHFRHFYYNAGWQIVETRKSTSGENTEPQTLRPEYQYVRSRRYIDAPVLRDENKDGDDYCNDANDERLYYLTDANMNVTALVDDDGDAVERYIYDPYGKVTILNGANGVDKDGVVTEWSEDTAQASDVDNAILFAGYWRDCDTGLYHVRHRAYHPNLGRWLQRDPLGYVDSMSLYEYCASMPLGYVDPMGLGFFGRVWGGVTATAEGTGQFAANLFWMSPVGQTIDSIGAGVQTVRTGRAVLPRGAQALQAAGQRMGRAYALERDYGAGRVAGVFLAGMVAVADVTPAGPGYRLVTGQDPVTLERLKPADRVEQGFWAVFNGIMDALAIRAGADAIARRLGPLPRPVRPGAAGQRPVIPEARARHIFRRSPGHIADTPANRNLLRSVASDPSATLGPDASGNTWSARTLPNGTQAWVQVRGGEIINGGINLTPRTYNPATGLSSPTPPTPTRGPS